MKKRVGRLPSEPARPREGGVMSMNAQCCVADHRRSGLPARAARRLPSRRRLALRWIAVAGTLVVVLAACSNGNQMSPSGIPTSTAPRSPAGSGSVWVANEGGDSLTVLDGALSTVATTLTGIKHPHNVQVSHDGATVYAVSNSDNIVVAIDPRLQGCRCSCHRTGSRACHRRAQREGLRHQHGRWHRIGVPRSRAPAGRPDSAR